jgi:hypothetical protein
MTDDAIDNRCPLCGGEITDIRTVGHWRERKELGSGGGFWLAGKCVPCGVDFQKAVSKTRPGGWRMTVAEREWLTEQIAEEEVARLTEKLSRYKVLGAKWAEFLAKKRLADQLWRFNNHTQEDKTGIAIVRNGIPIADFRAFGDL